MKATILVIFFSVLYLPVRAAKEPPAEYGQREPGMITLRGMGEFKKPGIYHVSAGISLSEFIGKMGLTRLANGRFSVARNIQGEKESFRVQKDRKASRNQNTLVLLEDIEMRDGDVVYAAFNLARQDPVQPPKPSAENHCG